MTLYLVLLLFQVCSIIGRSSPRVGVIGGGIGGTSVAYFVSKQIPGSSITVFEMGKVGGRLATVTIDGREYESGGSIIHSANKYMVDYLDICGLKKKNGTSEYGVGSGFAIHKDGEIVFQESTNFVLNTAQMIWRYGLWSLLKLDRFVTHVLDTFKDQIYPKLDGGQGFTSVSEFLEEVSPISKYGENSGEMLELTKISLWSQLVDRVGISPLLVEELGTVATRVNYGQFTQSMHAFVGSVGLAGTQGDLWAVEGGNYKVAECALERAGAKLVLSQVVSVDKSGDNGGYLVTVKGGSGGSRRLNEEGGGVQEDKVEKEYDDSVEKDEVLEFDIIVIASPQTKDKVRLSGNALNEVGNFPGKYHRTVATVVKGDLVPSALNFTDLSSFTTTNFFLSPSNYLISISKLSPVDYLGPEDDNLSVYKIFSTRQLVNEDLIKLFSPVYKVVVEDWLAYPNYNYSSGHSTDLTNFTLSPGLYYTSRIEWAASAMEMSVIAAKNVANIATHFWMGSDDISQATDKFDKLEL